MISSLSFLLWAKDRKLLYYKLLRKKQGLLELIFWLTHTLFICFFIIFFPIHVHIYVDLIVLSYHWVIWKHRQHTFCWGRSLGTVGHPRSMCHTVLEHTHTMMLPVGHLNTQYLPWHVQREKNCSLAISITNQI